MIDILKSAYPYQNEITIKMSECWYNEKYKYFFNEYGDSPSIDEHNFNKIQMISTDSSDNIIGFFNASVNRTSKVVSSISIINFTDNKLIFSRDLSDFFKYLFEIEKFHKIEFSVTVGNPIESSYDALMEKYNGCIVGTHKDHWFIHGEYHDLKMYEIMRKDYEKTK